MFFLGAKEGVAREAGRRLEQAVPGLRVDSHHGLFEKDDASSRVVIDSVNRSGAAVLLVGFGMPLQEVCVYNCVHYLFLCMYVHTLVYV